MDAPQNAEKSQETNASFSTSLHRKASRSFLPSKTLLQVIIHIYIYFVVVVCLLHPCCYSVSF